MFILDQRLESDCHYVADLPLSRVLLLDNTQVPWLILVPRVENVQESIDMTQQQQLQLHRESAFISGLLKSMFAPDKLNVAAIGNIVSQLHVHHIARFCNDCCWPAPVWGNIAPSPYEPVLLASRLDLLKQAIGDFS